MGLLERLKDMVATMNEEEKNEFFSEIEKEKQQEEEAAPEPAEPPSLVECSLEETSIIMHSRDQVLAAKVDLSAIVMSAREAESRGVSMVRAKEDELLTQINVIKNHYLPNPSDHDSYLVELPSSAGDTIKLVRQ